jgi:anti-sigma B factor antagonist
VGTLRAVVTGGSAGPLIALSGEADSTSVAELSHLITGQLTDGTPYLTIDASGLVFADTASIRVLVLAGRTLQQRGGNLVLVRPRPMLVRVLQIMGADQFITVREQADAAPEP